MEPEKLSTSALARKLGLPVQQLFATLKDYGWIQRYDDGWVLTNKGEFEGGTYIDSKRYGRYIVWPDTLENHPLLSAIESNQRVSASELRRYYPRLHARHINRALAELGLQVHSILGWELTARGKALGGQQEESEDSGAYYVTWPHEVIDNPVIHRELDSQSAACDGVSSEQPADDLFAGTNPTELVGIDGHALETGLELQVCNWLYLAQLAHAHQRALPVEAVLYADFYLPVAGVYIECWEAEEPSERLTLKLQKKEVYREERLRLIEVNAADADRLDEVLGRPLMAFGIRV